jgi:hypothetical protein
MTKPPKLPVLRLADAGTIAVTAISGHGAAEATIEVQKASQGRGNRPAVEGRVNRQNLTLFALELLDLAEQMVHQDAYASSTALANNDVTRALIDRRRKDATQRYFRIVDRLPILQLCQRVLERCDDTVAQTLLLLLGHAEANGTMPVTAKVHLNQVMTPQSDSSH